MQPMGWTAQLQSIYFNQYNLWKKVTDNRQLTACNKQGKTLNLFKYSR